MLGLRKRHLPWLAGAIAAAIAGPSPALARADAPPATASVTTYDFGFRDSTKSQDDPTASTVTIAPGGTVDFSYPTGTSFHNVAFGDPDTQQGAQPSSCVQTAGTIIGAVPPLPTVPFGSGWAGTCTFNTPGTYTFYCAAHTFMTGTVVVEAAQQNQPPTVHAARTPAGDVTTGTAISFTADGADPDSDTLTYSWDFGDSGTSTDRNPTHTYTAAGTYSAKVTVDDGQGGTATDTVSVTVTQANQAPTVTAARTPAGDVATGTAIAFSATAADPDGDTLTYAWDFGDGGTSTQQNPSHTYATAGSYTAKVTVDDGHGATATDTVAVKMTGACIAGTYRDDFNGASLDASWNVIRPDGAITVGNGVVSIPTEPGDIYQTTNTAGNFVLRPAPSGAFTITAKINLQAQTRYQQAGIIVYGDDDNYTKLDRGATNAASASPVEKFEFINEVAGTARNSSADYTPNLDETTFPADYYVRITSTDGTTITGAYSTDGSTWTPVGQSANLPANPQVGFFALSNGAATNVTAQFDWFQLDGDGVQGCAGGDQRPVISASGATPAVGIAPLPVNFTVSASDPDDDPLTYAWDFGDGATSTQQNPSHTYTAAGTYTAKVTVSDGKGGTATRTLPVTVMAPDAAGSRFRALVFSKTAAFRHDSIPSGIAAIQLLGQQNNFQVDTTEDGSLFRDDILSHYKVVIFLSTTGDVLTDDQQAAFQRYIEAGGGYAGVHSAADTEYTWPWYGKLVGAYFRDHPNGTPAGTVQVEDATDPSTAGLPARWDRTDEWYNFQTYDNPVVGGGTSATPYDPRDNADLHILLTTDTTTYTGAAPAGDHPIAWCHRYDGGRSWYTALGHTAASYTEPLFLQHLYGGIEVAAGVVPSVCGAEPTDAGSTTATGNISATVGSILALSMAPSASLGSVAPGVARDYTASLAATVTSTQGNATLSVADASGTSTGHLVNGDYVLPAPLQAQATNAAHPTSAFAPVTGADNPLALLTYNDPVSSDTVTVGFKQSVGAGDVLRAGSYGKTLTFTLASTAP